MHVLVQNEHQRIVVASAVAILVGLYNTYVCIFVCMSLCVKLDDILEI